MNEQFKVILTRNRRWAITADGSFVLRDGSTGSIVNVAQGDITFNAANKPIFRDTNIELGYETLDDEGNEGNKENIEKLLYRSPASADNGDGTSNDRNMSEDFNSANWQHNEVVALIAAVEGRYDDMYHPKKKKNFWQVLSEELDSQGIHFDSKKCKKKWENLIRTYKSTKDTKNKSGRCPTRFLYFDRLDELLGEKPNNCSPHSFDVASENTNNIFEEHHSGTHNIEEEHLEHERKESSAETKQLKNPKRKSVNAQYLDLKKSYYDTKGTAYSNYLSASLSRKQQKLELYERKLSLEERKVKALEFLVNKQ